MQSVLLFLSGLLQLCVGGKFEQAILWRTGLLGDILFGSNDHKKRSVELSFKREPLDQRFSGSVQIVSKTKNTAVGHLQPYTSQLRDNVDLIEQEISILNYLC